MQASLQHADRTQIPFESLIQLSKQQLSRLRVWSAFTSLNDQRITNFLVPYNIARSADLSTVTRNTITRAIKFHEDGNKFVFGNAESIVHSKGGAIVFSEGSVSVEMPNEPPIVYSTASGYPVAKPRPWLSGVLAICGSNFQINKGVLSYTFDAKVMGRVFPKTLSAIDPLNFDYVHSVLLAIMAPDAGYRRCVQEGRGMSGLEFWDYCASVLQTCPMVDYIALHDTICKRLLFLVEVKPNQHRAHDGSNAYVLGSRYKRADAKGIQTNIISQDTVKHWPVVTESPEWTEAVATVTRQFGHRPFALVGSIDQGHAWLKISEEVPLTEKDTYIAYATRRSLHASGTNGSAAILQSDGFSSIASKVSNRCVLLITLTMNALRMVQSVDLRCELADLAYLEAGLPLCVPKHHEKVRYLMDYSVATKVPVTLRTFVITNPRPEAHYVAWLDGDVESVPRGTEVSTHFELQYKMRMEHVPEESTVMVAVTSPSAFKKKFVHLWRGPADYHAIVSTLPKLYKWDPNSDAVKTMMPLVFGWDEFLAHVVKANARYSTWFLAPRGFYSPASNMIKGIAKATSLRFNDGLWTPVLYEEKDFAGAFIPDIIETSNTTKPTVLSGGPPPPPPPPFKALGGRGRGGPRGKLLSGKVYQEKPKDPLPVTPLVWDTGKAAEQPQPNGSSGPYGGASEVDDNDGAEIGGDDDNEFADAVLDGLWEK